MPDPIAPSLLVDDNGPFVVARPEEIGRIVHYLIERGVSCESRREGGKKVIRFDAPHDTPRIISLFEDWMTQYHRQTIELPPPRDAD